ncbi:twin-arginine translocase subunit TatB [Kribbella qitaiheensis]|uniref:Twin-arginine translocase subunit TatB n=1 Tax=Kribbella qitaiheensis TaxID=1544730 RepID=A0A7G6X582_9ACTN|nr:sec-independent translocase [Kribbella qitaiheensis]QNE21397.1 twin-arginine translocase subunit TatB [Kribbella qitaiheensis]
MLDIGLPEMLVIAVIAIVVLGPDRLPEFVRTAARLLNQVRGMAANAQKDLRDELGPEFADLDVRELNPRTFIRKHLLEGTEREATADAVRKTTPTFPSPYDHEAT